MIKYQKQGNLLCLRAYVKKFLLFLFILRNIQSYAFNGKSAELTQIIALFIEKYTLSQAETHRPQRFAVVTFQKFFHPHIDCDRAVFRLNAKRFALLVGLIFPLFKYTLPIEVLARAELFIHPLIKPAEAITVPF